MKHSNVSIFVTHVGCPHLCAFCNQRTITGTAEIPHADDVRRICCQAYSQIADKSQTEIAFFGGSFTAVPKDYMLELLEAANEFIGKDKFKGIRISTRPDYINEDVLDILNKYNVTSIELGAQSLCDEVLEANERGHSENDVNNACKLIKNYGFELGLQMMVGLYKSSYERELETMRKIIALSPRTVRIYPVVVLEGTKLAQLYNNNEYKLMPFETVVDLCAEMVCKFKNAEIDVIKLGLHSSELVQNNVVAGYYHPAFSELVYSRIILTSILKYAVDNKLKMLDISICNRDHSIVTGHKRSNLNALEEAGLKCNILSDNTLNRFEIKINGDYLDVFKITGDPGFQVIPG